MLFGSYHESEERICSEMVQGNGKKVAVEKSEKERKREIKEIVAEERSATLAAEMTTGNMVAQLELEATTNAGLTLEAYRMRIREDGESKKRQMN